MINWTYKRDKYISYVFEYTNVLGYMYVDILAVVIKFLTIWKGVHQNILPSMILDPSYI